MKKAIALVLCLVLALALFAGCGSSSTSTEPTAPAAPATPAAPAAPEKAEQPEVVDDYPNAPITVYVHTAAGGAADNIIRTLQPFLEAELGTTLVIEYKEGAGSLMGPKLVSQAEGDGYLIGMFGSPTLEVGLLTMEDMFELDDIAPLCRLTLDTSGIMVRADSPWNTIDDLVEAAKANPGEINAAVGAVNSDHYLGLRLLEEAAGIDLNIVNFGGNAPSRLALLGEHVDVREATTLGEGKNLASMKVLGIYWEKNEWEDILGDVPTMVSKYPDIPKINLGIMNCLAAPASLKADYPARYEKLVNALDKACNNPDFIAAMEDIMPGLLNYWGPDDLTSYLNDNIVSCEKYLPYYSEEVEEQTIETK